MSELFPAQKDAHRLKGAALLALCLKLLHSVREANFFNISPFHLSQPDCNVTLETAAFSYTPIQRNWYSFMHCLVFILRNESDAAS